MNSRWKNMWMLTFPLVVGLTHLEATFFILSFPRIGELGAFLFATILGITEAWLGPTRGWAWVIGVLNPSFIEFVAIEVAWLAIAPLSLSLLALAPLLPPLAALSPLPPHLEPLPLPLPALALLPLPCYHLHSSLYSSLHLHCHLYLPMLKPVLGVSILFA